MKPQQIAGLGLIVVGVLFITGLIGPKSFCLGPSVFGSCIGQEIPLSLGIGLVVLVIGALVYLRGGQRRRGNASLKALGLLLVLIALIGIVGATSGLSVLPTAGVLTRTNYPIALVLFAILGAFLYFRGRVRR